MKLTEMFIADLERETAGTRRALERVPEGANDWKPHPKSMPLGYLAALVAVLPSWIVMMIRQDSHDLALQERSPYHPKPQPTTRDLVGLFEGSVIAASAALRSTTDEHLLTRWELRWGERVVGNDPRHVAIRDGVLSHLAHHRGQLTVYLRLNEKAVPALYGPTADEQF